MKPIKKIDISAMKKADTICLRTVTVSPGVYTSTVECSKKKSDSNPFEDNYIFNVDHKYNPIPFNKDRFCFEMFNMYDWDLSPLKTAISLLREDDTIQLVWYKDAGNTEDLKKNDFVSDHLYLEIIRKGEVKYNFLLSVSTGRDNSARMIKCYR